MSKETNPPAAVGAIFTRLRTIARRVKPALEYAVRELAGVALPAPALSELRASAAGVMVLEWVPPASLLPRVGVRTLSPVM